MQQNLQQLSLSTAGRLALKDPVDFVAGGWNLKMMKGTGVNNLVVEFEVNWIKENAL